MRNHAQGESFSKMNTITRNSNMFLENLSNSSNILTANHFYKRKEINGQTNSREKNRTKQDNNNSSNEIIKELKKMNDDNIVVHNQFLNNKQIKFKIKKVKSEVELFQNFILQNFQNQNAKDNRNVIEKLGACVEKKYNIIRYWKNNNSRSNRIKGTMSLRKKGLNYINEYNKNLTNITSKRHKHSFSTSHYMDTKSQDSFPLLINNPLNLEKKFNSLSEKERDDKNISALIKLKHFLSMRWNQRKDIVKEFFEKNNIYEDSFYEDEHLYNFANFINFNVFDDKNGTKCNIETRYPMIDIISKGIKYKHNFDEDKTEINKIDINQDIIKIPKISETIDDFNRKKELTDYFEGRDKVNKYRNFLNKNYKSYLMKKMLKGLTKEEKKNYFSGKKYGVIDIPDKKNIANNIHKQAFYQKIYDSQIKENLSKKSIKYFNNDDLKKLNEELKVASDSIFKKAIDEKKLIQKEKNIGIKHLKISNKTINKLNQRLYYTIKINYLKNNPDIIPKKKHKLLEYVIAKRIKERKDYLDKFKQNNN